MIAFVLWYVVVSMTGLLLFPVVYRLLPSLPGRGYAFSRGIGLLAWGYVFWLLTSLGILRNNPGGLLAALGIVLILSYWAIRGISGRELSAWFRKNRTYILVVEILFLVAFGAWSLVRAANPEIQFTEKPMELAFINAILHSPEFPPHDPWLSGYAISYYYFGYVLVGMLAKITAVSGGVAFNLGVALVFGLSATGAFGLVYDLFEIWRRRSTNIESSEEEISDNRRSGWKVAFLGPFFVLVMGNLEGLLEVLHARGIFWSENVSGELTSTFWRWLDMKELSQPPTFPLSWMPSRFLWWWRASRVVQDYDLAGNWKEVIDEFPFFSFLLADLHPHVLAIPFALVAIALAFNLYLGGGQGRLRLIRFNLAIDPKYFVLGSLVLGGLAFLNTWDFPIYVALFSGAYVLRQLHERGWAWSLLGEFILSGLSLGITGVLLYLPFYLGFSSQAGGVIPNLIYVTRGTHLWVMFGTFLIPLFAFLIYLWRRNGNVFRLKRGLLVSLAVTLSLFILALWMALAILNIPFLRDLYLGSLGAVVGQQGELFRQALERRLLMPGGWITLVLLLTLSIGLLWPEKVEEKTEKIAEDPNLESPLTPNSKRGLPDATIFSLVLIFFGALLILGPEFFYLRDQFGYRINTIFKFYYQAWILFGIAAAYGTAVLVHELRGLWGYLFDVGISITIVAALIYPTLSTWTKTDGFNPTYGWTLDGTIYMEKQSPDEMAAIDWLKAAPPGVVAEAVGGSYSQFARVATNSGQPTVLGWPAHESQWRGGSEEMGSRQSEIERLFSTNDWDEAQEILRQFDIRYVYVGPLEKTTYRVSENKFKRFLQPVFQEGQVTIYEVPQYASQP